MWTGQELTVVDSLMISATGILVVFSALAALAIAIIIITKILSAVTGKEAPAKPVTAVSAPAPGIDEEAYAVIIAAVNEEARLSGETVQIKSIREL